MPGPSANTIKTGEQPGDDIETLENDANEVVGSHNPSVDDNKNEDSHDSGNVEELQKDQGQIMKNYVETFQKEAQEAGLTKTQNVEEAFAAEVSNFFGVEMDLKKGLEQDKLYEEKYAPKTRMAGMRTIIMDNKDGIDDSNKALLEEHNSTMVAEYTKEEEIRNKFADELIEQEENEKLKRSRDSEKKKKKKQKKKEAFGEIKAEEKKEETSSSSSEEETEDGGPKEPIIQTADALTEFESKLAEITFDQKMSSKAKKSPVQSNGPNGVDTEKKISHCQGSQGKNEAKRNQSIEKITGKNKKKDEPSSKLTEIEEVSQVIDLPEEKAKNTDEYVAATLPTPEKKPAAQNAPVVSHQIGYRLTEPVNNWEEIVDGPAAEAKDDKKQEANAFELASQLEKVVQTTSETLTTAHQELQEKAPEKVVVEVASKTTVQVKEPPKVDIAATNKNQAIKSKNDEKINASPNKLYNQQQHYSDRGAAKVRHTPNKDYGRGRNLLPQQVAPRYQQPTQFQQPRNQVHMPQPPPQLPQPQFVQRPIVQPIKPIEQVKKEPAARKPTEFEVNINSYFVPEWQNIRQLKEELITELEKHTVSDQARALFSSLVKNQTRDTLDQLNVLKQSMKNDEFWSLFQKFLLTGTESNFCGIHAIACSEIIDVTTKGDCTETCFVSQIVSLITKENNSKMIEKALNQSTFTEKRNFMHYVCLTGNPCCITASAPIVSNYLLQSKDISGLTPVDYTVLRNEVTSLKIMQKMGAPVNFKVPRWYMENSPIEDWNSAGWEQVKSLELQMNVAMEGWLNLAATGVMNVGPAISNVVIGKYESGKKFHSQLHFHDQDFIIKNAMQPPNIPKKENILMSIVTFHYDPLTESEPSLVSISKPKGEEGATVPAQFLKTIKFVSQKVAMSKTYPLTYVSSNVSSLAPAIVSIVVPGESPFVDIEMSNHPADKDTLVAIQCFKVVYRLQSECSISTPPGLEPQMSPRHIVPVEMYPQVLPNQNFYQPQHYQPMIPQLFHNSQPPPGPAYPNQLYQGPIQNHPNFIPPNLGMPPTMFNPIVSQPILGFPGYISQQYSQHPAHPPHQMYPPPHPHQQYQRY